MTHEWIIFSILVVSSIALLIAERMGVPTTLVLDFKGDIKRESRWFAQYGQAVCTIVAGALLYQLDPSRRNAFWPMMIAVFGASVSSMLVKRLLGRVRPNREQAGQFLGPTWKHANYRESFPSSHSACAIALSAFLVYLYPQAAATFWALGIICAVLRYLLDAHWPSDILAGCGIGYVAAWVTIRAFHL